MPVVRILDKFSVVRWVNRSSGHPALVKPPITDRNCALELAVVATETGVANGCRPSGAAAACVIRAAEDCGWPHTQQAVADAANTTPMTVRAHEEALDEALSD